MLLEGNLEDHDDYREVKVFLVLDVENGRLEGMLDKYFVRAQLPDGKLGGLVSAIGVGSSAAGPRDVLDQVYEYFLGMFANAEGHRGGPKQKPG